MSDRNDSLMAQLLAEMSVISEQKGRAHDGISVHGGDRDRSPAPLAEKPMVDYWRDRYNGTGSARARYIVVLEATEALKIARRMPVPTGQEPEYGSAQWKRWVAESKLDAGELARRFNVTRRYINMVRQQYAP